MREIFQKQYDFELEQRNSIASAINIPVVSLTVLGSALSAMIVGYKYSNHWLSYLFITILTISVLTMFFSIYCIVRSFLGYSYHKIPPSRSLNEHFDDLKEWHINDGREEDLASKLAKLDFDDYLDDRLSEAADHNSSNNIRRGNYLHDATAAVTIAFIFLLCSTPFYIFQKVLTDSKILQVEIVNNSTLTNGASIMIDNSDNGNTTTTPQASPSPTPEVAPTQNTSPKPAGPQNIVFKGNSETGKLTTRSTTVIKTLTRGDNGK